MSTRRFTPLFHARGILLSAVIVVTIAVLLLTACPNPTTVRYEPYVSPGAVSPSDPLFASDQWDMDLIDAPEAWGIIDSKPGELSSVVVAVVDSGVLSSHEDFNTGDTVINDADWKDFTPSPFGTPVDTNGHGTHVTGTVAAIRNAVGIAGVGSGRVHILPVRVFDASGTGTTTVVASGIEYAAGNAVDKPATLPHVINLSLGGGYPDPALYDAIQGAVDKGITVVAASGNDDGGSVQYPAAFDNTIAVGSVGADSRWVAYSDYGQQISLVAPGGTVTDPIWSTFNGSDADYQHEIGTSMATPHVAGVAALLYSYAPNLNQSQVFTILIDTAEDLGAPGWDKYYGHGLINAKRALEYLISAADMPPLTALGTGSVGASSASGTAVSVAATALPGVKPVQRSGAILPQGGPAEYAPDSIIVKLKAGAESRNVTVEGRLGQTSGVASVGRSAGRFRTVRLTPGKSVTEVIRRVASDPDVEYAQPNYIYHLIQ